MSVKEEILLKTKKVLERKINKLEAICGARPWHVIIELRKQVNEAIQKYDVRDPELMKILDNAIVEEKKQKMIFAKQRNMVALLDKLCKYKFELEQVVDELWLMSARKNGIFR